ncbi:MAG TPA: diaminopimelate decarboxylase [Coxiellaceae bacterium]|nr:diaminopimelate decarboxylase [Coxiellaceae bacterium]
MHNTVLSPIEWWKSHRNALLSLAHQQTPVYVYHADTIRSQIITLKKIKTVKRFFYSMKANDCQDVLRVIEQEGLGFECVSRGELEYLEECFPQLSPDRILFTPNFCAKTDYEYARDRGVWITVDNEYPLRHWPHSFQGARLLVRLDIGEGKGHHDYVKTAGGEAKFGIEASQWSEICALISQHHLNVVGLHAHAGSGIEDVNHWASVLRALEEFAKALPTITVLNMGGGLGVGTPALNMEAIDHSLKNTAYEIWLEPGRFIVADSGVLLLRVTQLKYKKGVNFVGVDGGMNVLIRPALYQAYHDIINLSRFNNPLNFRAHIVGPICESADVLGKDRLLATPEVGDIFLMTQTGAYGAVMSSHYNRQVAAAEVVLSI